MELSHFDLIIVNSSGGKDSLCALWEVCRQAKNQGFPLYKIVVSHQDLGEMEWEGTKELVMEQANLFGLKTYYSKRRNQNGYEEDLLEYVERRGKWPSNKQRYCTSDFKRGPGARIVTALTKEMKHSRLLYVFGFRTEESPFRSKKPAFLKNKRLTTNSREVYDWLPIHNWNLKKVWSVIKSNKLPYHKAYDLGMPRLSCMFCIFSPLDALVIAGQQNPKLLERYIEVERKIGHNFRSDFKISMVKEKIESGYYPDKVNNWIM